METQLCVCVGCSDGRVTVGVQLTMAPYNEADASVHTHAFPLRDPHHSPVDLRQQTDVLLCAYSKGRPD